MDPEFNPFNPGAGTKPPELAGRGHIVADAKTAIARLSSGKHDKSQLLLGLRGVGKTVLLNIIAEIAEGRKLQAAFIEAPEDRTFLEKFVPQIRKTLLQIDRIAKLRAALAEARIALRNFASVFKIKAGEVEVGVTPELGVADSGDLTTDLTDLMVATAKAAQSASTGIVLLIDEVQYLSSEELSALIVALHRVSQLSLPGPHASGDIAKAMGQPVQHAAPIRGELIAKGMIYSPAYGRTAFTVPMFDGYLRRVVLKLDSPPPRRAAKAARKKN